MWWMRSVKSCNKISSRCYCDILPASEIRIIRKTESKIDNLKQERDVEQVKNQESTKSCTEFRVNDVNIQMISTNIYNQLFKTKGDLVDIKVIQR